MRLTKIIAALTAMFWAVQSLVFVFLFASSFTDLIVRFFITLGVPAPESSLTLFLSGATKVLSWPVRVLFSSAWAQANSATAILLLGLNSAIWGIFFGVIVYFLARNRTRPAVSHS